jgi:plasmid stabilization system protein ParE
MDFKINWSDSAISDLKGICDYITCDKPKAVEKVGRRILKTVKLLETFPLIGPAYPRRASGRIREIVSENYRIFYEVLDQEKAGYVLRIWHGARGEPIIY